MQSSTWGLFVLFIVQLVFASFFDFSHSSANTDRGGMQNSQVMQLLSAPLSPNTTEYTARGGGDVVIVDNALLPESGPRSDDGQRQMPTSDAISVYVVREGDTLSQIAEMFEVSVNTIRWANDVRRNVEIQPGDTLVILPVTGVQHEIEVDDTLKSIVAKYEADLTEVINYNNIGEKDVLVVGDVITVPNGEVHSITVSSPVSSSSGSSSVRDAGYFVRPIAGGVRSQGMHGYNAVDLATYIGADIYAAAAGQVIISKNAGWNGGYGNYMVIKHDNGIQTLYAHNNNNTVSVGQWVTQGQLIGHVGSTGRSTGPHLHFEIRGAHNPF